MDLDTSPDHPPPDHDTRPPPSSMAAMVANGNAPNMPGPTTNKRYRPAPAKTFQCRGYGECRMVFSRSEHLARHIRKHTGERPFSCHCGKQFSRLDNLRQHAQTVHSDKQEQNERMMRDLTSLHATMAAANKIGSTRGTRRATNLPALALGPLTSMGTNSAPGEPSPNDTLNLIKQEDGGPTPAAPIHQSQRPGTSTGYEGEMVYDHSPSWNVQQNEMEVQQQHHSQQQQQHRHPHHQQQQHPHDTRRLSGQHSFRDDPSQSFLAPQSSTSAMQQSSHGSFRGYSNYDGSINSRPASSSRPPTSSGISDAQRSLPPLAAVVSASLPSPPLPGSTFQSGAQSQLGFGSQSQGQSFPFPGSLALRRPGTASSRPGTAPAGASASFFNDGVPPGSSSGKFTAYSSLGTGLGGSSLLHSGFGGGRSSSSGLSSFGFMGGYDAHSTSAGPGQPGGSPTGGPNEPSPFYFQPPALEQQQQAGTSPSASNPRKRAFGGPDGPFEHDAPAGREPAGVGLGLGGFSGLSGASAVSGGYGHAGEQGNGGGGYEYGTESRPQSRRLSVMELCNDDAQRQQHAHQITLASALATAAANGERDRYGAYGNANTNGGANGTGNASSNGTGSFLLPAAGSTGTGTGGYGSYGNSTSAGGSGAGTSRPTTSSGLVTSASALHIFDNDDREGEDSRTARSDGTRGCARGGSSPDIYSGTANAAASSVGIISGNPGARGSDAGASYTRGDSPATSARGAGSHSPPGSYATGGGPGPGGIYGTSFRSIPSAAGGASPALSVVGAHSHGHAPTHPTPTPSPHPGLLSAAPYALATSPTVSIYSTQPTGAAQQYQFAGSPTFSGASSVASYASPRSPLSDGSGGSPSPFSPYAQPQHRPSPVHHPQQYTTPYDHSHHHQQQQQYHAAQQYAGQRVSPVQYDTTASPAPSQYTSGYEYDTTGVPRSRTHFQQQQQYGAVGQHGHDGHGHVGRCGTGNGRGNEQRYIVGHGHEQHGVHDAQVRISVSPHATPTFGMRV